jgi:hypothetical protein
VLPGPNGEFVHTGTNAGPLADWLPSESYESSIKSLGLSDCDK